MENLDSSQQWQVIPRVRYYGQPISLGLTLAGMGGVMSYMMLLAFKPEEHWALSLATILMGAGFFAVFIMGAGMLLTPFHKLYISRQEIRLQLGSMILRRIPVENVRSITAKTREVIIRNKDVNLHRMTINCNGTGSNSRGLWVDWNGETEAVLRTTLDTVNFLF